MFGHDIIVVGASIGGIEALAAIARGLPADIPTAIFVVVHTSPESPGFLPDILRRHGPLPAAHAVDGEVVAVGRIYVARPDHHLLLESGRVRVARGPKENRFRPAVDTLFRSAALAYGPRVVGVVLTGALDDGEAGLRAVKACGGVGVVQDPDEARFDSMPRNAMKQARVDYRLRLADIPPLPARPASRPAGSPAGLPIPEGIAIEAGIAAGDKALDRGVEALGEPSKSTCPECHGALIRLKGGGGHRFRCHTGHAYTADALLAELTGSVEEVLWNSSRAVEESVLLMEHIAAHVREGGDAGMARAYERKAAAARERGELVRRAALRHEAVSEDTIRGGGALESRADPATSPTIDES